MWRTRVGYAGGAYENPTYRDLGDQTECFQVDFDPDRVSYEDLLELAFTMHDPGRPAHKVQYASLVLTHDDEQLAIAQGTAADLERLYGRPLATRIEPLRRFWLAEDYHQKYYLRNDATLFAEVMAHLPSETAFVDSTIAARINGYLDGMGTSARLAHEVESFGLTEAGAARLTAFVERAGAGHGCPVG